MERESIEIRRLEPDDYPAMQRIASQPKAIWGTLQLPFSSAETWKKRLATTEQDGVYMLGASIGGHLVGSLGLNLFERSPRRRHAAGLGMFVHDDWQGRGVGRALMEAGLDLADNWLNLGRLELTVFTDNAPAIKLYESVGFEVEGRHRWYAFRSGQFVDALAMARLRQPMAGQPVEPLEQWVGPQQGGRR